MLHEIRHVIIYYRQWRTLSDDYPQANISSRILLGLVRLSHIPASCQAANLPTSISGDSRNRNRIPIPPSEFWSHLEKALDEIANLERKLLKLYHLDSWTFEILGGVTAPFNSIPAAGLPESTPLQTVIWSSCSRSHLGLLDDESRASLLYNTHCLAQKNKAHKGKTSSFQALAFELSLWLSNIWKKHKSQKLNQMTRFKSPMPYWVQIKQNGYRGLQRGSTVLS